MHIARDGTESKCGLCDGFGGGIACRGFTPDARTIPPSEQFPPAATPTPSPLWWMSFVDEEKFLGVAIVAAPSSRLAIAMSHALGCNPGGEVQIAGPLDPDLLVDVTLVGKLLDADTANAVQWKTPTDRTRS